MAKRRPAIRIDVEGEIHTVDANRLDLVLRIINSFLRINYVFLAPWIILSLPSAALAQQSILLVASIVIVGSAGMFLTSRTAILIASGSLMLLIVWGKVAGDIYGLPGPDSALFLLQFMLVIFLMEASSTVHSLDSTIKDLKAKNDDLSSEARRQVITWERVQLYSLGRLTLASFGLSLGLLVLGSFVGVSVNQIAFSGTLVLAAVVAIFVLLTYRREPVTPRRSSR
jgi:hypothetical protein